MAYGSTGGDGAKGGKSQPWVVSRRVDAGTIPPSPALAARVSEVRERARRSRPGTPRVPGRVVLLCLSTEVEVSAAILLPAILVVVSTNRSILAVRDRIDAVGADSQIDQEILG